MKKNSFIPFLICVAIGASLLGSCKKDDDTPPPMAATLYDSLGGKTMVADPANSGAMIEKGRLGIRSVIDSTIFVIAGDSRINDHFTVLLAEVTNNDLSGFMELSKNLTDFVATATGATSYTYNGMNMVAAHDPAQNSRMDGKATNADFDAFVQDVVAGANKNGLPANLIQSLGRLLETLRDPVVQM